MAFSANIFLFAFLPLFLACYYLTPWHARSALILAFSWAFFVEQALRSAEMAGKRSFAALISPNGLSTSN